MCHHPFTPHLLCTHYSLHLFCDHFLLLAIYMYCNSITIVILSHIVHGEPYQDVSLMFLFFVSL